MPTLQMTWVEFKQFFSTVHHKLQETTEIIVQDAGMHHSNMVDGVVSVLQEVLQQEQAPTKTPETIAEPSEHVANAVKTTQQ